MHHFVKTVSRSSMNKDFLAFVSTFGFDFLYDYFPSGKVSSLKTFSDDRLKRWVLKAEFYLTPKTSTEAATAEAAKNSDFLAFLALVQKVTVQ